MIENKQDPEVTSVLAFANRSDTFTSAASGTIVNLTANPCKYFSLVVKGTGGAASIWIVILEGSLDGTNWTPLLTNSSAGGATDGTIMFTTTASPVMYVRSRCSSLTLGISATNVVATILASQ